MFACHLNSKHEIWVCLEQEFMESCISSFTFQMERDIQNWGVNDLIKAQL